jgi:hypothetical protein
MTRGETTITNDATDTEFHKALRWRVHDPEESLWVAATHRARAAEARGAVPVGDASFRARSQALGLEARAKRHDELAAACERHAADLQALEGKSFSRPPRAFHGFPP